MKKGTEIAMYSERTRRPSPRRANDEFLRRMVGGELNADLAVMNRSAGTQEPSPTARRGSACNGESSDCPTTVASPSLAMVYAPVQCWQSILDNATALKHGTLFAELVMPLEVGKPNGNGGQNPHARGDA